MVEKLFSLSQAAPAWPQDTKLLKLSHQQQIQSTTIKQTKNINDIINFLSISQAAQHLTHLLSSTSCHITINHNIQQINQKYINQ